jgi:hypothetical protein
MRLFALGLALAFSLALLPVVAQAVPAEESHPLHDDALIPPPPSQPALAGIGSAPRGPSQFMAGSVAVRLLLPESDGSIDPSTEDWSPAQIDAVRAQVQAALDWWAAQLSMARLSFELTVEVAPTGYEPIRYGLADEGRWVGDTLARLGFAGASYFDQAYAAAEALREERGADWATTLFVVNSANYSSGYLPDGRFAYAYINGPFLVLTSDAGVYGTQRMAAVAAHELGHTFGALDQYAAARVACDRRSGYLDTPTSNSQYGGCGAGAPSIMLEPIGAFGAGRIDTSALQQLGYRDSDGDGLIDPLDTQPALALSESALAAGSGRPVLEGRASDQPLPSTYHPDVTLNHITAVEYRVDGGPWIPAAAVDGGFDSGDEEFSAELPLYDGSYTVELRAVNSAGGASAPVARRITVAGVGPQPIYGVTAPALTNSPDLTLALQGPAGAAVQVSADPSFQNAPWQPYAPELRHTLAGDGAHTLYVRFRDEVGLASLAYATGVTVDTIPPHGSVMRDPGDTARLLLSAGDEGSGLAEVAVHVGQAGPLWMPYAASVELAQAPAEQAVSVQFRDAAGNLSPLYAAASGYRVALPLLAR